MTIKLYTALIYQALQDLYSKRKTRKYAARDWINSNYDKTNPPVVTFEECCDLSKGNAWQFRKIAKGILSGKLSRATFRLIYKDIMDE